MKIPDHIYMAGDRAYRGDCPTEQQEQATFFAELRRRYPELGRIALHPKNEGKRHLQRYQRDVLDGLSVGAADIVIPGAPTFACELKRRDHTKSKISAAQIEWLTTAQDQGAYVCVALGWEAAFEELEKWITRGAENE